MRVQGIKRMTLPPQLAAQLAVRAGPRSVQRLSWHTSGGRVMPE
jgi:hypothetical protein